MNKQPSTAVRYKLRQFQWFQMQTRVRQIIQQLLAPFSKRIFQTMSNISSLKSFTMQQSQKLQELRKVVTDDPSSKQIDIFKVIDRKQEQMEVEIAQMRNLLGETGKVIDGRFKIQDERLEESKEIVLNNMKLKERISEEIMEQNESLKEFREESGRVLEEMSRMIGGVVRDHEEDVKGIREGMGRLEERIGRLEEFKRGTEVKFQTNKEEHSNFHRQNIRHDSNIQLISKQIAALNENLSYTKKLSIYVKQLQQRINKQDFKIQHLAPLVTQAQITETLYNVLPNKMRKRLVVYDYYKYGKMNAGILEVDPKKYQNEKFNGVEMLEAVEKRTTKVIIEMKRKKLLEDGIDIDNLTYEMKQKCYKEVNLQQDHPTEDQQETKPTPGVDKDEITEMIQQMLSLTQKQLTRQITDEFIDTKKYMESLEEQLQHNLVMTNEVIERLREEGRAGKVEQELYNKYMEGRMESVAEGSERGLREMAGVRESLVGFIKFCSLVNHLQIQDELDKQSISLFGVKETFNDNPNGGDSGGEVGEYRSNSRVVDLKKECFSCCGFPASTMAAFKMACLTYAPSPILLQNREYRREQILQMSTKLLHNLKSQVMDPPIPSQVQNQTLYSSIQTTAHRKNVMTFTQESQAHNNVFHYDSHELSKTHYGNFKEKEVKRSLKLEKGLEEERESKRRNISTAKTNYRTSTRISSSMRSTNRKMENSSLVSTIFTEQQKKHAFYLV